MIEVKMSSFKFYLPCRNSVRPFGIQCVSEFSAQIFLTVVGIQCLSEFSAQSEFSAGTIHNMWALLAIRPKISIRNVLILCLRVNNDKCNFNTAIKQKLIPSSVTKTRGTSKTLGKTKL